MSGVATEQLHIINKHGQQIDIPLLEDKDLATAVDTGDGTCLTVYMNGRKLYAPTTNQKDIPDEACMMLKDANGEIRYIHQIYGTKTAVLYATYTGSFTISGLECPFGGYIIAKSSNGSSGSSGTGTTKGGSGGNSGMGWSINVNGTSYVIPSGGGGGGGGAGGRRASGGNAKDGSPGGGGGGGYGSTVTIPFEDTVLTVNGTRGQNAGSGRNGTAGGAGGNSYPDSVSTATLHKGNSGASGSAGGNYSYNGRVIRYGSPGGAGGEGGYGYQEHDNVSQSTYSVQIFRYLYI